MVNAYANTALAFFAETLRPFFSISKMGIVLKKWWRRLFFVQKMRGEEVIPLLPCVIIGCFLSN
jgi:hypothetical protein